MEVDDRECHCVGTVNKTLARTLRDEFCRNVSLPGNGLVVGTSTPPNGRRCGTYKPENPTADDLCFCDSPLKQSSTNFSDEFYSNFQYSRVYSLPQETSSGTRSS